MVQGLGLLVHSVGSSRASCMFVGTPQRSLYVKLLLSVGSVRVQGVRIKPCPRAGWEGREKVKAPGVESPRALAVSLFRRKGD